MSIEHAPIHRVMPVVVDYEDQELIGRAVTILMESEPPTTFMVTPGRHGRRLMMSRNSLRTLKRALLAAEALSAPPDPDELVGTSVEVHIPDQRDRSNGA